VEDDAGVRKALKRLLCAAGFDAQAFGSAEEFLRDTELECHSCLILDVKLPGMSGFELSGRLEEKGVHVPTIFVTADEKYWERAATLQVGHKVCLLKPITDSALLGAVRDAFSCAS
jgi:FixJ family two-component response regulator